MGLGLVGRHPIRSKGGYSNRPGLDATSHSDARALHDSLLILVLLHIIAEEIIFD